MQAQRASLISGFMAAVLSMGLMADTPGNVASTFWTTASLESAGLNVTAIQALHAEIEAGDHGLIDSLLIVHDGAIVFEATYPHDYATLNEGLSYPSPPPWDYYNAQSYPWRGGTQLHSMQSVSKSVMSALIGIAIERGDLPGIAMTLSEMLPHRHITEPTKAGITLESILTMTPGFEWNEWISYFDPANDATATERTSDWVAYLLAKPIAAPQGTVFNYNSSATQLLSEALASAVGRSTADYAKEHLFEPIGITEFYWNEAPEGFTNAGGGLFLSPRDLARFALLYEQEGVWNGTQVVPKAWVQASSTPWVVDIDPDDPAYDMGYGYQWWVYRQGNGDGPVMYGGWGWGGQFPLIIPDMDLVVVFTGWNIREESEFAYPFDLFYDRIILGTDAGR
ncbi:MAG: serine hydrolase [Cellvibrionales bacterium]|jgi:CubicO group peptidase (beta-lactamase class C family)